MGSGMLIWYPIYPLNQIKYQSEISPKSHPAKPTIVKQGVKCDLEICFAYTPYLDCSDLRDWKKYWDFLVIITEIMSKLSYFTVKFNEAFQYFGHNILWPDVTLVRFMHIFFFICNYLHSTTFYNSLKKGILRLEQLGRLNYIQHFT